MTENSPQALVELTKEIKVLKTKIAKMERFLRSFSSYSDYEKTKKITKAENDTILQKAIALTKEHDQMSASLLQRKLSIGYARSARILDQIEEMGLVGPQIGASPRKVVKK